MSSASPDDERATSVTGGPSADGHVEPEARRGFLGRRSGRSSPAPADVDQDALEAGAARETAAREAAERAAAVHAKQTSRAEAAATRAARDRERAEQAARDEAARARAEAQRRTVAEQLASETVEQMALANAERLRVEQEAREAAAAAEAAHLARTQAEEAALRASLEREAAEAHARVQAEAAERALADRSAAEARARELAVSLEEARAALLEQTQATIAAEPAPVPTPEPAPAPAAAPAPEAPEPEPKIQPEGVPEVVRFHSPGSSAVLTLLLGLGALVAAGVTVYEAYLDQLTTTPGLVAGAVTLVLVLLVGRAKGSVGHVWLERGVLHVDEGDSRRQFDLTTPDTKVEMVGKPGERRWRVLIFRKGSAPYEVNARLVDPEPFVEALRPWRPRLGG